MTAVACSTLPKADKGSEQPPSTPPAPTDTAPQIPQTPEVGSDAIVYSNSEYGFTFALPKSWEGYKIINDTWQGTKLDNNTQVATTGPMILIRHPQWTEANVRQDIPIMVFTIDQWDAMNKDQFHIGAAPVNPSELDRNSKYVFALPARYNIAFPTGFEEVDQILQGHALKAK
jgi:hypothetical protein